ncbi:MAG: hypothetical protein K2L03_04730 [Bacteroidales bacterium]|nr:hypothetical protein [Bacteroidales bacterium]
MKTKRFTKRTAAIIYTFLTVIACAPPHAAAQPPTERPVGILSPQTLPPTFDAAVFGARISSEQDFVAMPGHPQTYRLDLFGRPLRQLYLGGHVAHEGSGLQRTLSSEINLAADLAIAPAWRFFGGLAAGIGYRYYQRDNIVTEHPFYDEALTDTRFRYTVGAMTNLTHETPQGRRWGFGSRADLVTDDKTVSTRSFLFYESDARQQAKTACRAYFVHSFYSHMKTKHYYKTGCRLDLFQRRFAIEAAYEASADLQTLAAGLSIGLCKGLTVSYDLSLPFYFNGRNAGAAAHTVAIAYRLQTPMQKAPLTQEIPEEQ